MAENVKGHSLDKDHKVNDETENEFGSESSNETLEQGSSHAPQGLERRQKGQIRDKIHPGAYADWFPWKQRSGN